MQTIAAISTPAGAGAIAIIRMSGDDALAIAARLFSCSELGDFSQAEPRKMYLGTINAGEYADRCLAVRFKAPNAERALRTRANSPSARFWRASWRSATPRRS